MPTDLSLMNPLLGLNLVTVTMAVFDNAPGIVTILLENETIRQWSLAPSKKWTLAEG